MALAPMEDVTDTVFRRIVAEAARPDIFFTEFASVDGLFSRGREAVIHRFDFTQEERPIIAQVWGSEPGLFYKAAKLVADMKFDGIDINMGCPVKSVLQHDAGAACIQDPERAAEIIAAAREGAGTLPLSVKTRLGYKKISEDWIPFLLEQHLDALTIHGRTAAELSKVPAHWDKIGEAVSLRNQMKVHTVILGNGDIADYAGAVTKCNEYGVDGVMIGRGIFHNLWAFDKTGESRMDDHKELFRIMQKHVTLFDETWGKHKNFAIMKKFFKIYVQGFDGASEMREQLFRLESADEFFEFTKRFIT